MINSRRYIMIFLVLFFLSVRPVFGAEKKSTQPSYTNISAAACGVVSVPSLLASHTTVTQIQMDNTPTDSVAFTRITPVCQFDMDNDVVYDSATPITITAHYTDDKGYRPRLYMWDGNKGMWVALPSTMDRVAKLVTADIHVSYARFAVGIEERASYEGVASWYADRRYPDGAATDLYPVGTHLKVTNLDTGSVTIVTTSSTWSNPNKTRIIDLVKTAFVIIADPRRGLIHARIEKLF